VGDPLLKQDGIRFGQSRLQQGVGVRGGRLDLPPSVGRSSRRVGRLWIVQNRGGKSLHLLVAPQLTERDDQHRPALVSQLGTELVCLLQHADRAVEAPLGAQRERSLSGLLGVGSIVVDRGAGVRDRWRGFRLHGRGWGPTAAERDEQPDESTKLHLGRIGEHHPSRHGPELGPQMRSLQLPLRQP